MPSQHKLEQYADMLIRAGLNLRPGQRLLIGPGSFIAGAPLEAAPLVRALVRKAYEAGARYVDVIWDDEDLMLARFQHAPRDSFSEFPTWRAQLTLDYAKKGDAMLVIYAQKPDLLAGQDPELIGQVQKLTNQYMKPVSELIQRPSTNWLVVSAPTEAWAAQVLPNVPAEERIERLWDIIFKMCRVTDDDPVAGWRDHVRRLLTRADYLNQKQYDALHYTAPGTDLLIGLPPKHIWQSGALTAENGVLFTANIPTEEVFTLPHRDRINGTLRATKPLSYGGMLMDDFELTFKDGVIVGVKAKQGQQHLENLLNTDEGARRIGEVALVPHSSPISASGLQFSNMLYDENASNHLAFGEAYRFSLEGGQAMSKDEFAAAGGNLSLIHVDFMVGSPQMDIDGILPDGTREPVFRQGEWAFEV
jgi:aminopeptidase